MKKLYIAIALITLSFGLKSQKLNDTLFLIKGDTVNCKIIDIGNIYLNYTEVNKYGNGVSNYVTQLKNIKRYKIFNQKEVLVNHDIKSDMILNNKLDSLNFKNQQIDKLLTDMNIIIQYNYKAGNELKLASKHYYKGTLYSVIGYSISLLGFNLAANSNTYYDFNTGHLKQNGHPTLYTIVGVAGLIFGSAGIILRFESHTHVSKAGRYLQ